jgi:hypothetical protein
MEANDLPWSPETDQFIDSIDKKMTQGYNVSLRDLILNPDKFASMKDIAGKIDGMRKDIGAYFTKIRDSMKDEEEAFEKLLEQADAQYTKIDGILSTKTALSRVPYIRPELIDADPNVKEEIFISQYNNSIDSLIAKLINVSNYVANLSGTYKKYNLGSWLFSGQKAYVLTINVPQNPFMTIDRIDEEINTLLDGAAARIQISKK